MHAPIIHVSCDKLLIYLECVYMIISLISSIRRHTVNPNSHIYKHVILDKQALKQTPIKSRLNKHLMWWWHRQTRILLRISNPQLHVKEKPHIPRAVIYIYMCYNVQVVTYIAHENLECAWSLYCETIYLHFVFFLFCGVQIPHIPPTSSHICVCQRIQCLFTYTGIFDSLKITNNRPNPTTPKQCKAVKHHTNIKR